MGGGERERGEVYTGLWCGKIREREQLKDKGIDRRIILIWIFRKWHVGVWNESIRLRIGTGGWML
jgi:hypothetical protein